MSELEKIRANAEVVVRDVGPLSGLGEAFGYNRESLDYVEGYVERLRNSGMFEEEQQLQNLTAVFGSFLGECIVRNYDGEWRKQDRRWAIYFDDSSAAFPFSKMMKQFENGLEGGDSILGFFDMIPRVLLKRNTK